MYVCWYVCEGQDSLVSDLARSEFQYFTGKFSGLWAGNQIQPFPPLVNPDLHVCMYVCMYVVCMCMCMMYVQYVCMYVCMYDVCTSMYHVLNTVYMK